MSCGMIILYNMDTDSFIAYMKPHNIYKDNTEDVETRFGTWDYELDHCIKEKIKKQLVN